MVRRLVLLLAACGASAPDENGCDPTTTEIAVTNGTCRVYDNCPVGGQVELCTFPGMGHCWAGGAASARIYACPTYADATAIEWQFFEQYAWN